MAFGEQSPTSGETPISWQSFDDGAGGAPETSGDADWGKIVVQSGNEVRSRVYDLGDTTQRTFTIAIDTYGSGSGSGTVQIRGNSSYFAQDDVSPSWVSAPQTQSWQFVQVRITKS